jgi:hypothetical protein
MDPSASGIAILGRFRTPSGAVSDVPIDPACLAKTMAQPPTGQSLEQWLARAAEMGTQQCPPKSRPVAIIGIGLAPPDDAWWKGDFDESKHRRWPANAPNGQGGRFRTQEDNGTGGKLVREATKRVLRRLVLRRAFRTAIMAILRVGAEVAAGPIGDLIAVIDTVRTIAELRKLSIAADAAREFISKAPYSLEDLRVSQDFESFSSHDAFVKDFPTIEERLVPTIEEWLIKRFGSAGPGYQYHHIVEQGGENEKNIPAEQLHNTDNMIFIPTLVHEAINAKMYEKVDPELAKTDLTYREWLPKQPYSVQREAGIHIMREFGIIK